MSQRTRKARNVARDPRVAISITDRNQPHTAAVVRGRVTERIEGDPAWVIIDRLSHKYVGEPYSPRGVRTPRRWMDGVFLLNVEAFMCCGVLPGWRRPRPVEHAGHLG